MIHFRGKNIYIISPESWGVNFVSKHHFAKELTKRQNNVVFLNPPIAAIFPTKIRKEIIYENLMVVNYEYPKGINNLVGFVSRFIQQIHSKWLVYRLGITPDIVWSFDPYVFQDFRGFGKNIFKIYHPVDYHHTDLDQYLELQCDLFLTSAPVILAKYLNQENSSKKHFIGHGLDTIFLVSSKIAPVGGRPDATRIGIVGNLDKKIDFQIIFDCINKCSFCDFHFIGPHGKSNLGNMERNTDQIDLLKNCTNVHIHGEKDKSELPEWIRAMDIFLICYSNDENPATLQNPHKVLEFLSTGNVIVSSRLEAYINQKDMKDIIVMCESNTDLPNLLVRVVKNIKYFNSPLLESKRIDYASRRTYPVLIDHIEELT